MGDTHGGLPWKTTMSWLPIAESTPSGAGPIISNAVSWARSRFTRNSGHDRVPFGLHLNGSSGHAAVAAGLARASNSESAVISAAWMQSGIPTPS